MIDELRKEVKEIKDQLDSIHFRMDKFYVWASELQKEYRNMQQRLVCIENNAELVKRV